MIWELVGEWGKKVSLTSVLDHLLGDGPLDLCLLPTAMAGGDSKIENLAPAWVKISQNEFFS